MLWAQEDASAAASTASANALGPEAQAVVDQQNAARAEHGLAPLTLNPLLTQAAQNHVDDLIAHGMYGHYGSDGSNVRMRVARTSYNAGGWVSENWVTAGNAQSAMQWWMNDWIHRENILNPNWSEIGVGVGIHPGYGMLIFVVDFTRGQQGDAVVAENNAPAMVDPTPLEIPADGLDYTIRPGDTLWTIAARFGIDWTEIARANRLGGQSLLQIDDHLRLPGVNSVGGPEATVQAPEPQSAPKDGQPYTVKAGDTLLSIALQHGLSWQELAENNGLAEDDLLQIDQELRVPASTVPVSVAEESAVAPQVGVFIPAVAVVAATPAYHTVQRGDTMISIALEYGLDWYDLLRLNHLTKSSLLSLGQRIRLN